MQTAQREIQQGLKCLENNEFQFHEMKKRLPVTGVKFDDRERCIYPGSALEGGAVFKREGQASVSVGRGVVQQPAPELLVEGGNLAVLLFQNPEEILHC